MSAQPGILAPLPRFGRYLSFRLTAQERAGEAIEALGRLPVDETVVVGIGPSLCAALGKSVAGLREHPQLAEARVAIPVTPRAAFAWLRGDDPGSLLHASRRMASALAPALEVEEAVSAFQHLDSRDLSGFEDGTENPVEGAAEAAALVTGCGAELDGSSFVAVQRWVHDFAALDAMSIAEQSHVIGRDKDSNEELEDAPPSAHVKRAAQESFAPNAFVVRRSMPWSDGREHGLVFVAFGKSLDAFEALLRRMTGVEDGLTDALFRFTRPVTGATFWCPPIRAGRLELRTLTG